MKPASRGRRRIPPACRAATSSILPTGRAGASRLAAIGRVHHQPDTALHLWRVSGSRCETAGTRRLQITPRNDSRRGPPPAAVLASLALEHRTDASALDFAHCSAGPAHPGGGRAMAGAPLGGLDSPVEHAPARNAPDHRPADAGGGAGDAFCWARGWPGWLRRTAFPAGMPSSGC